MNHCFNQISDISNCACTSCSKTDEPMDVNSGPSTAHPGLSASGRQRQSMEIREKYSATSILHAAMMVHAELGNDLAKKIHKLLIDDPESNGKV